MKKILLFFAILALSLSCFSQITFQKSYFITNEGKKIECLIKNEDWRNNPTEFKYKISENGEIETATIQNIKEFGIYQESKYIRCNVKIDRSSPKVNHLSTEKQAIFNEEQLFLKELISGKANLYQYCQEDIIRYFFSTDRIELTQLVFKLYLQDEDKIARNNKFRRQIWGYMRCDALSLSLIEKLRYHKKDLTKVFMKYNQFHNPDYSTNSFQKEKKKLFHVNIRPGIIQSSTVIKNDFTSSGTIDIKNQKELRFGAEAELFLPFNKNKWSLIVEPAFHKFSKSIQQENNKIDFNFIDISFGARHYLYLNKKSSLFVNCIYAINFLDKNSKLDFYPYKEMETKSFKGLMLGLGYNFKKKYSVEMRYGNNTGLFNEVDGWTTEYKTLSLIFGYTLF